MNTTLKMMLVLFAAASFSTQSKAQGLNMPQASTTQTLTQNFGLGKITLNYSRPNVKGRQIFGGLTPYGEVWRTGANSATVISFSEEVKIEGQLLPAGEYGLFTIPEKNEWTVIFNKGSKQWGSYTYNQADDALRIKVKPTVLKDKVESFTIQFANVYPTSAQMQLLWDKTGISLNLTTEVDAKVMANIDEAMKGEKKPYMQAAVYYFENGKDLSKAMEWMNKADEGNTNAPWVKLWKAKMQLKSGDKAGAAKTAEEGLKIAKEINNAEYIRLNTALIAEAKK